MSDNRELELMVSEAKSKTDNKVFSLLEIATGFLSFVNLPLGITLTAATLAIDTLNKNKSLNNTFMDDEWLQKVSKSKSVSKEGLSFLSACLLKNNNKVSLKDALKFIDIEKDVQLRKGHTLRLGNKSSESGAQAILKKSQNEGYVEYQESKELKKKQNMKLIMDIAPKLIGIGLTLATRGKKK